MKEEKIRHIKEMSAKLVKYYKSLYDIDKIIMDGRTDECSNCLERLLKIKGDAIINICMCKHLTESKCLRQIENEIDDLFLNLNIRIDILKNMAMAGGSDKSSCLKKYKEIYHPMWIYRILYTIRDRIQIPYIFEISSFYSIALIGILAVKLLQCFNVIVDENYNKYVVLLTYLYFLLGRIKKISLDGIRFWKPKNWNENIRN